MSMLWIFLILFTTSFFYVTILSFHKLLGAFLVKNTLSDRLNYLTTLAEEQSITRAAARLFISQPALTAFLNRTEEELGVRLFDRSTTPIRITKAGAYYLSELEKICVMQDRLHQELSDFSSNDPELRINIGIGRNRGSIWLSSVMPELNRLYPDMRLTIFEDRDINMLDKVLNGVLDIAIVESYVTIPRCTICGCHPSSICSSPAAKTHGWPPTGTPPAARKRRWISTPTGWRMICSSASASKAA